MFPVVSPISAFVEGVKMGSGSRRVHRARAAGCRNTQCPAYGTLEAAAGQVAAHNALGGNMSALFTSMKRPRR